MSIFSETLAWLCDPANWAGSGGIPTRVGQHLAITVIAVLVAAAFSLPAGVLIGHTRRGAGIIGGLAGAARALPTLGLLTLLGLAFGIGLTAPLLALIILAIPSLLAGAYAGVQAVDPTLPSAARAVGFSPAQVILRVEVPLALPTLIGGLRAATLQVVSTATLAAYTADFGLGRYLFAGLKTRDYPQMLGGTILVIALTLILDVVLACCQRAAQKVRDPGGTLGSDQLSTASHRHPISATRRTH